MAKKRTLEERAEKKFPIAAGSSEKEIQAILSMRRSWIKVEKIKIAEKEKKKKQADREALAIGRALVKSTPELTAATLNHDFFRISMENRKIVAELESIARRVVFSSEKNDWLWTEGALTEMYELLNRLRR